MKRVQSAARRASGPVSVEIQRRWYQNDLQHDLGLDPAGKTQKRQVRDRSNSFSGAKLITFLLLAALASLLAFTVHLSREGKFDFLFAGEPIARPDLSWMGAAKDRAAAIGQQVTEAVTETPAPPNFFEPEPPAKTQAGTSSAPDEVEPEAEASESNDSSEAAEAEL